MIIRYLATLSGAERREFMEKITDKYCSDCWEEHPTTGRCQCCNDE